MPAGGGWRLSDTDHVSRVVGESGPGSVIGLSGRALGPGLADSARRHRRGSIGCDASQALLPC